MFDRGIDPGRIEDDLGARELAIETRLSIAANGLAHRRERLAGDLLHVGDLGPRPVGFPRQETAGELALDGDQREAMAKNVVEVAGDPVALLGDGQRGELLARHVELRCSSGAARSSRRP